MSDTSVLLPAARVTLFSTDETSHQVTQSLSDDWRYARVQISTQSGGVDEAIQFYQTNTSPDLLIIQTDIIDESFTDKLGTLADYCAEGTDAIIIGPDNDVQLYRQLISMGVSDYIVRPLETPVFAEVIAKTLITKLGVSGSRLIVTLGAKGGVGTSCLSQNLALALADLYGQKTFLMDAAGGWSPNTIGIGLEPSTTLSEATKAAHKQDQDSLKRMILKGSEKLELLGSGGDVMLEQAIDREGLESLLDMIMATHPLVIFDASSLAPELKKAVLLKAHKILLFGTPSLFALRMTRTLIHEIKDIRGIKEDDETKNLLSFYMNFKGQSGKSELNPKEVQEMLDFPVSATLPFLPDLFARMESQGVKLSEDSEGQPILHALIQSLQGTVAGLKAQEKNHKKTEAGNGINGLLKKITGK